MFAHDAYAKELLLTAYRKDIDGLRAIAILAVLINHVDRRLLSGGYVGVDVFFVISGFLVTAIIERDVASGRFSFTDFYARRAKRLLPAALFMNACTMAMAAWLFLPTDFADLGKQVAASTAMLSNVLFWRWNDYFAGQNLTWPLLHTWSLSVEEQFYLLYPPLLLLAARLGQTWKSRLLAGLLAISFAVSVYQATCDTRSAYYLLSSRAWELLAGGLVALITIRQPTPRLSLAANAAGLLGIALPMFSYTEQTPFPGIPALLPVVGTVLLLVSGQRTTCVTRLLTSPPLVAVGRMSYSLYLWHWPLLMIAAYPWAAAPTTRPWWLSYAAGVVAFVVAYFSFHFIETPMRAARITARAALVMAACASLVAVGSGLAVYRCNGFPGRLPSEAVMYARGAFDFQPRRRETIDLPARDVRAGLYARLGDRTASDEPSFVLWGDSTADALVPAFDAAGRDDKRAGIALTKGGTPPLIGLQVRFEGRLSNADFSTAAVSVIQAIRPEVVVLAARWSSYLDPANEFRNGQTFTADPATKARILRQSLEATIAMLRESGVSNIVLLREVPAQRFHVPHQMAWNTAWGQPAPKSKCRSTHTAETALADSLLKGCTSHDVTFIDIYDALFNGDQSLLLDTVGSPLYSDAVHLSVAGAHFLENAVAAVLRVRSTSNALDKAGPDKPSRGPASR